MTRKPRTLKQRVLGPPLLFGTIAIVVAVAVSYLVLRKIATHVGELRAESLTRAIENAAQVTTTAGELQRFIAALGAETDVRLAVLVAGSPPIVIASTKRALLGEPEDVLDAEGRASLQAVRTARPGGGRRASGRFGAASVLLPGLEFSRRSLSRGLVLVELEEPPLQAEINALAVAFLIAGVVLTLLWALQTALLLQRHVLGPVAALRRDVLAEQGHDSGLNAAKNSDELLDLHGAVLAAFRRLRETFEQLNKAKDAAESGARARTEFLAMMSHEIRTPMNGVLGVVQLVKQTELTQEQADLIEVIESSGQSLLIILNDVLDFSKIESGKLNIEQMPLSPASLLTSVQHLFAPTAKKKGLDFQVQSADIPDTVLGDPTRIRQVLTNLVSNAVKFTERGGISVRLSAPSAGRLEFEVEDTGIGIPPAHLPKLFDKFSQVDISTTRKYGGTGLGMAIAHRLVHLMGGELRVHSVVGQGTRFTFNVPCPTIQRVAQSDEMASLAGGDPSSTRPKRSALRVLVAEDNEINQLVISRMLQGLNGEVTIAKHGADAVIAFEQGRFDVVLMDCQMPELDGYDATRMIRAIEVREGRSRTPILALTANAFAASEDLCTKCGMDGCLTKPLRVEQLRAALKEVSTDPR